MIEVCENREKMLSKIRRWRHRRWELQPLPDTTQVENTRDECLRAPPGRYLGLQSVVGLNWTDEMEPAVQGKFTVHSLEIAEALLTSNNAQPTMFGYPWRPFWLGSDNQGTAEWHFLSIWTRHICSPSSCFLWILRFGLVCGSFVRRVTFQSLRAASITVAFINCCMSSCRYS